MNEEELIETLRAFEKNRVEQLEKPARNLFYAIMKIADERDRLNNIIKEVREYIDTLHIDEYDGNGYWLRHKDNEDLSIEEIKTKLLEILDKGE